MGIQWKDGFSAHVELFLLVEDKKLRVAQVGPESLILRDTCSIPPGTRGRILIKVDDKQKEHDVLLHKGIVAGSERVEFF